MNSEPILEIASTGLENTLEIAHTLGARLKGGETIELVGDLGSGKTAFVRGLARGINSADKVQSPSFTIGRMYKGKSAAGDKITINHFDFHRLDTAGIMELDVAESLQKPGAVIVSEWAEPILKILPRDRLRIEFQTTSENGRLIRFYAETKRYQELLKDLK